jgi:hypothetical protein
MKANINRVIKNAKELGELRAVSLDEAVNALVDINEAAETIAHRANACQDSTALMVLGQIDRGENKIATVRSIIGTTTELSFMICEAMRKVPALKIIIKQTLLAEGDL